MCRTSSANVIGHPQAEFAAALYRSGRALASAVSAAALASVVGATLPAALAVGIVLGVPAAAEAEAEAAKPIVVYVEGPDAESVRGEVLSILPGTLKVVEPAQFSDALVKAGQTGAIGNTMAVSKQRAKLLERIQQATKQVGAAGAIVSRIRTTRTGGRELWVLFVDPNRGDLAIDEAVPLPPDSSERKSKLRAAIEPSVKDLAPAAFGPKAGPANNLADDGPKTGEGGEAGEEPKKAEPETPRTPNDMGSAILVIGLSLQVGGRFFAYSDGVTSNLRPYSVFGPPMMDARLEFYPIGLAGDVPVAKDIGVTASYGMAFGLNSATEGGEPIGTSWYRLNVGLRGRIRLGSELPSSVLGINAGFGMLNFNFDAAGELAEEVPDVSYKLLRFGLDGRFAVGPIALEAGGDFLMPLANGAVYDRFTEPRVYGIDARGGLAIPIAAGFEARLMGEYTRFFSSFAPEVGDAYVAGGALDQLVEIRLGAAYAY